MAGTETETGQASADRESTMAAAANHQRMEAMQKTKPAATISAEGGLSYAVRVEAAFGSQFQRTDAIKNLNKVLAAWKELALSQHKKNAITVTRIKD